MIIQVCEGIALYAVLAWKLYQLCWAPQDRSLRLVTLCLAFGVAAYPFEVIIGDAVRSQTTVGPILLVWAHEVFLLPLVYVLICFFVFSALESSQARKYAWRQALPLVIALAILTTAAWILFPKGDPAHYPLSVVSILFLTADVYTAYGFAVALMWMRRYAREAGARLRRGLLLASIGLAAMTVATLLLIAIVIVRWASGAAPAVLVAAQGILLVPGILVFILGVSYPGAAMRLIAVHVWYKHLRAYHQLRPLWTALNEAFPDDSLHRARGSYWPELIMLHSVHRRYYRRVIECRDGLVRLSPCIAMVRDEEGEDLALGNQVIRALQIRAEGLPVSGHAVAVATPAERGLDADVTELVALSQQLRPQ